MLSMQFFFNQGCLYLFLARCFSLSVVPFRSHFWPTQSVGQNCVRKSDYANKNRSVRELLSGEIKCNIILVAVDFGFGLPPILHAVHWHCVYAPYYSSMHVCVCACVCVCVGPVLANSIGLRRGLFIFFISLCRRGWL